jgi:hypothetical protein
MPLLIQSLCKDAEDPQNHCIFDSRTRWHNNKIQKFQMYQSMIYLKMIFVSLQYNYILALEAEERGEEQQKQRLGEADLPAGGADHLSGAAGQGHGSLKKEDSSMTITLDSWTQNSD